MSVIIYQSTRRKIPEDLKLQQHRYDNFRICKAEIMCVPNIHSYVRKLRFIKATSLAVYGKPL